MGFRSCKCGRVRDICNTIKNSVKWEPNLRSYWFSHYLNIQKNHLLAKVITVSCNTRMRCNRYCDYHYRLAIYSCQMQLLHSYMRCGVASVCPPSMHACTVTSVTLLLVGLPTWSESRFKWLNGNESAGFHSMMGMRCYGFIPIWVN